MKTIPSEMVCEHHSPFEVVWKAIGGEETVQSWVHETNYRANRYFDSTRNVDEEEEARENDYAPAQGDNTKQRKLYGRVWTDVGFRELMMWMAICLFMVVIGLAQEKDYWSTTAVGLLPAMNFSRMTGMSFRRWRQIKRFFNCKAIRPDDMQNNPDEPRYKKTKDKLHRCRPFINTVKRMARAMCVPGFKWSIDESIIPYFGSFCPIKVYMKDKPHKFGMKVWGLWCAVTSYCLDFHVYEGRGDRFLGESSKWVKFWNLGERVILAFAKLIPAGSFIFTDRFFTTPRVGAYLRDIYDVYLTGTLMKNTKGVDKDIMFKKSRKFGRGFFKWSFDHVAKVIQCCWLDRGPVLFMSTMISACIVGGLSRLTWSAEKGYRREDMQCPEMAREYNQEGMGGGDSNDRMKLNKRTSCEMNLFSKRWDWRLFWGIMDIAITNAFILYLFFHPSTTHQDFFRSVANEFFIIAKKDLRGPVASQRASTRNNSSGDGSGEDADIEEVQAVHPASVHKRYHFKGRYKRACYVCMQKRNITSISERPRKCSGTVRENLKRPHSGCKFCNVALCEGPSCWKTFHEEYPGVRQNFSMDFWESSDDTISE